VSDREEDEDDEAVQATPNASAHARLARDRERLETLLLTAPPTACIGTRRRRNVFLALVHSFNQVIRKF
jgi:hypothetical protein